MEELEVKYLTKENYDENNFSVNVDENGLLEILIRNNFEVFEIDSGKTFNAYPFYYQNKVCYFPFKETEELEVLTFDTLPFIHYSFTLGNNNLIPIITYGNENNSIAIFENFFKTYHDELDSIKKKYLKGISKNQ